jgi:hypothetical protein
MTRKKKPEPEALRFKKGARLSLTDGARRILRKAGVLKNREIPECVVTRGGNTEIEVKVGPRQPGRYHSGHFTLLAEPKEEAQPQPFSERVKPFLRNPDDPHIQELLKKIS